MKITEIFDPILDVLNEKKFVGDFEVTIYHVGMEDAKISGHKTYSSFPYEFQRDLQNKINEICFSIVRGKLNDGDFNFDIKGQIAYLYTHGEDEWN